MASELEASDSGFYSSPIVSARLESRNKSNDLSSPINALQLELERLNRNTSPINEIPSNSGSQREDNNNCEASTSMDALKLDMSTLTESEYYDVPSKAILDAVKRSMSADERRRARSASHTPHSSLDNTTNHSPRIQHKTSTPRGASLQQTRRKNLEVFDEELAVGDDKDEKVLDPQPSTSTQVQRQKSYRNASCSPIRVETPPDEPTPRGPCTGTSSVFFPYSGATSYMPNSSAEDTTSHLLSSSSPSSSSGEEEETPRSADSLQNYNGPRFGQPGSPGSRDLEFSLRKMQLHKKVSLLN